MLFCLANKHGSTEIEGSISLAVRGADKISMTKNIFGESQVMTTLTAEKFSSFKQNATDVWQKCSYFKQQPCDFTMEKDNYPEMFFINQGYQSYKDNKVYFGDYCITGQVNQCLNPPENLSTPEFQENEAKIYRPRYDMVTACTKPLDI